MHLDKGERLRRCRRLEFRGTWWWCWWWCGMMHLDRGERLRWCRRLEFRRMIDVWSILDWSSRDFGFTLEWNFDSKGPWEEHWDCFELILGSWRDVGEVVWSLMLENRSQNEGILAAHFDFEAKSESASLLWASQSLPKGLPNRIKVMKINNHQRIDKLYAFEGGFLVSLDVKMMIFSNKFRRWNYQL